MSALSSAIRVGLAVLSLSVGAGVLLAAEPPKVGEAAPDFELKSLKGEKAALSELVKDGPVVLVVLRGYPGYQCPACTQQSGEFISKAKAFAKADAQIVLIYPGPAEKLAEHADEFIRGKSLPENVHFLIDPDYSFVNAYHLRWDAPNETAYPSTFVVDGKQQVVYSKISQSHGGRTKPDDVLKAVPKK
ncbi:MAG TPA: redoxin domain-containing protein [Pirellulales bacterium]